MFVELSIIEEIDIIKREIENEEKQIEKLYNRLATQSKNPIEIKFILYELKDHYEIDEKYTATGEYMILFDEDILKANVKILKVILKSNTEYINTMEAELEKLEEANIEKLYS